MLKLKKDRVVVFIDELPWMDTSKSNFLAALSSFWNGWRSKKTFLKLYVCGSATTWMVDKFIGDKGGLYGRVSRPIYLAPFTLLETEQYLNEIKKMKYGRKLVLDTYMIFRGIPYYLDMLNKPCIIGIIMAIGIYMMVQNCCGSMISGIDIIAVLLVIILGTVFWGSRKIKKNGNSPILLIIISAGSGFFFYGFR